MDTFPVDICTGISCSNVWEDYQDNNIIPLHLPHGCLHDFPTPKDTIPGKDSTDSSTAIALKLTAFNFAESVRINTDPTSEKYTSQEANLMKGEKLKNNKII